MPNEAVETVSSYPHRAVNQNKYQGRIGRRYFGEANGALQTNRHQYSLHRGGHATATPHGTFEHVLNHLFDHELDISGLDARFNNDDTGAPALPPAMLLKVVLFSYSQGVVSSRNIERACREHVTFIALSGDIQVDDSFWHTVILEDCILPTTKLLLVIINRITMKQPLANSHYCEAEVRFARLLVQPTPSTCSASLLCWK